MNETEELVRNSPSQKRKSGRQAAALEENPHSYLSSMVINEAPQVKKYVAKLPNLDKNVLNLNSIKMSRMAWRELGPGGRWSGAAKPVMGAG